VNLHFGKVVVGKNSQGCALYTSNHLEPEGMSSAQMRADGSSM